MSNECGLFKMTIKRVDYPAVVLVLLIGSIILLGGYPDLLTLPVSFAGVTIITLFTKHSYIVPKTWLCILAIGTILSSLHYLPTSSIPQWRTELLSAGIALQTSSNPQGLLSLEYYSWGIFFLLSVFVVIQPIQKINPQKIIAAITILLTLLSIILTVGFFTNSKYTLQTESQVFSFFPSRNQSALLLVFTSALLLDYSINHLKNQKYPIGISLACVASIPVICILQYPPRAGILLLGISVVYLFFRHTQNLSAAIRWSLLLSGILVGFTILTISSSNAWDRILHKSFSTDNFRTDIYQSTIELILDHPFGIGWGNFVHVFPQYWERGFSTTQFTHPESSALWALAEGGWLLGFFILFILGMYFLKQHKTERTSLQKISCFLFTLFLLHSIIDVSAHRWGTGWLAAIFFIISLGSLEQAVKAIRFPTFFIRFMVLCSFGITFYLYSSQSVESQLTKISSAIESNSTKQLIPLVTDGKNKYPMVPEFYFFEGQLFHQLQSNERAKESFSQLSYLRPYDFNLRWDELLFWITIDADYALKRALPLLSLNQVDNSDIYLRVIQLFNKYPETSAKLGKYLSQQTNGLLPYLNYANQSSIISYIEKHLVAQNTLSTLSPAEKDLLFTKLVSMKLTGVLDTWKEQSITSYANYRIRAKYHAQHKEYEKASLLYLENIPTPSLPIQAQNDQALSTQMKELQRVQSLIANNANSLDIQQAIAQFESYGQEIPFTTYWKARILTQEERYEDAFKYWKLIKK